MIQFRTVEAYRDYLRHIVSKSGFPGESHKIRRIPISKNIRAEGLIRTDSIVFRDGAFLRFEEKINIDSGAVKRLAYAYHYENSTYYFRYDKDKLRARGLAHAECHLHVSGHEDIRYLTHETHFEEVFEFILATFYPSSSP
jgi:hypothetical protein